MDLEKDDTEDDEHLPVTNTCQLVLVEETDKTVIVFSLNLFSLSQSKRISNDQELMQSDPTSCPQNQN